MVHLGSALAPKANSACMSSYASGEKKSDQSGIRTHALSDQRLKLAP